MGSEVGGRTRDLGSPETNTAVRRSGSEDFPIVRPTHVVHFLFVAVELYSAEGLLVLQRNKVR